MTSDLNLLKMNKFVLSKQRLTDEKTDECLVEIVRAIGGLHATIPTTPYLSLFARVKDFRREQLDEELYVKRNLGKIRYVRTTIHLLPKGFVQIALTATRTLTEPASQGYARFIGVTQEQYTEVSAQIIGILNGKKGMTTKQIKRQLQTTLNVSPIVNLMCDQGLLIRGAPEKGWRSNMHTYYLLKDYFSDFDWNNVSERDAKKAVVRQYLASYGPVTENDVIWWTGFGTGQVKPIIEDLRNDLTCVAISGIDKTFIILSQDRPELMATKTTGKHIVSMLPTLDPYLMGYKDRERYLDLAYFDYVYDRGGNAAATILLDGKIIGVWDFDDLFIKIFFFESVTENVLKRVKVKAQNMGAFMSGKYMKVKECSSMIPLTQRTAGGFMSPLKSDGLARAASVRVID